MTVPCVYFSRLTVDEERSFFAGRIEQVQHLLSAMRGSAHLEALRGAFAGHLGVDPFEPALGYRLPSDIMTNRLRQMALFLLVA